MFNELIKNICKLKTEYEDELIIADNYIKEIASTNKLIQKNIGHFLMSGKKIRSILFFYFFIGKSNRWNIKLEKMQNSNYYKIPAIVEIVHSASLFHDDVIDFASTRRDEATFAVRFGEKRSVLMGDYLMSKAISHMYALKIDNYIKKLFVRESVSTAYGAILELLNQNDVSIEKCIRIASLKTASFFKFICFAGALLGSEDFENSKKAAIFGKCFGIIYQIQNDINSYLQNDFLRAEDFVQKNITFPIVLMSQHDKGIISKFHCSTNQDLFDEIKEYILSNQFKEDTTRIVGKYLKIIEGSIHNV